ncbi:protein distal antenna-like [Cotesia glomerata]|uniref:HTH psq-type domain-containing protein n=1 Tax=Cotesia glomerata TaxID=32391 RepID=A0AAV7J9H2_COTGL|nr:protein distal antenna-like [Cotesia glomerata]KAH0569027.1 hypothetical protein KQX54_021733 [Cotesia glomerata]
MKGDTARPGKRPLRSLSTAEKIEAIQRVHEGESKASVARDIGVPESTLRGWCKSEEKIRGLARNSPPSDIEAKSPLSVASNSAPAVSTDAFYGDEVPAAKKLKTDHQRRISNSYGVKENLENDASRVSDLDYMKLFNTLSQSGFANPNQIALLQQFNLGYNVNNFNQPLLDFAKMVSGPTPNGLSASLVENGLQYTRNSKNSNRHSIGVATPIQRNDQRNDYHALNYGRKSLPSAAEAPSLGSMSPRKSPEMGRESKSKIRNPAPSQARNYSNNYHRQSNNINDYSSVASSNNNNNNINAAVRDHIKINRNNYSNFNHLNEPLWDYKMAQQQAIDLATNCDKDGEASFFSWYIHSIVESHRTGTTPAASTAAIPTPVSTTTTATFSPVVTQAKQANNFNSKNRAILDQILHNNNNTGNVKTSVNATAVNSNENSRDGAEEDDDEENKPTTKLEAIEHGIKFLSFLNKTESPSVTMVDIMRFARLLQKVQTQDFKIKRTKLRKNSTVIQYTSESSVTSENNE